MDILPATLPDRTRDVVQWPDHVACSESSALRILTCNRTGRKRNDECTVAVRAEKLGDASDFWATSHDKEDLRTPPGTPC